MNHTQSVARLTWRAGTVSLLLTALLVFSLGGIVQPALAQTSGVTLQATPAFGGNFKYGEWLPVMVELTNSGSDVDGAIEVEITGSQGTLIFQAPVSLPAGAHKRVPIYVLPNNFSRQLDIHLVSQNKTIASTRANVHPQPNITYFIGLLAPQRGGLALLSGITFPGQERPKVIVDVTLDELPERPEGLRALDLLVINDTDTSRLTPSQATALEDWVQQGGRLVLGSGANAQQVFSGLPSAILPVTIQSTVTLSAAALQPLVEFAGGKPVQAPGPFVAARGVSQNSTVLAGDADFPLIQERIISDGAVDFVALDLAGIPFDGWPGAQTFWETLLGPGRAFPDNMPFDVSPRQLRANSFSYAVSNIPSLDLPSLKSLSILLGFYILLVGPLNYLLLRRLKRLQLAWVTIPLLTLIFSAGTFGIAYGLRGNDLILNKIALVETHPGGDAAVTSYMGLFSPRMESYTITIQSDGLVSPMSYDTGVAYGTSGVGSRMIFVQGQPSQVKGLSVNQWAMQSFMAEATWPSFGEIRGDLRVQDEALTGTVRNDTQYTLKDAVLALQTRFVRLGDLAPGETREVNLGLSNLQSDRFNPPLTYQLYQEPYAGGPQPRDLQIKSNIISATFENGMYSKSSMLDVGVVPGKSSMTPGIIVFGWLDQAPPAVEVPNSRLSQQATALVYSSLDYSLPESGRLALPPGMIPGVVTKLPENGGTCGIALSLHMTSGDAQINYTLPEALKNFSVDALKLALRADSGLSTDIPAVALYNWHDQSWTSLQGPIQGTNIIQNPAPYISDGGLVHVRLHTEDEMKGCLYIDLGLEAHKQPEGGN